MGMRSETLGLQLSRSLIFSLFFFLAISKGMLALENRKQLLCWTGGCFTLRLSLLHISEEKKTQLYESSVVIQMDQDKFWRWKPRQLSPPYWTGSSWIIFVSSVSGSGSSDFPSLAQFLDAAAESCSSWQEITAASHFCLISRILSKNKNTHSI